MGRVLLLAVCLAGVGLALTMPVAVTDSGVVETTPGDLAGKMRSWAAALDNSKELDLHAAFPSSWRVRSGEREYSIPSARVREFIGRADRKAAGAWLIAMAEQLESNSDAASVSPGLARGRLRMILQRPEFAPTPPPSALTKLIERGSAFLSRVLRRIFGRFHGHVTGGWQIFYGVLAACFLGLAWFGYRVFRGRQASARVGTAAVENAPEMRAWQHWLGAAEAARADGDFRKAVQCAYWAGVMRLQEAGDLPREATHTPREYLRLVTNSGAAPETLRQLTSSLERFWYAGMTANAEDAGACFESFKRLEAISAAGLR